MYRKHGRDNYLIKDEGVYRAGCGFGKGANRATSIEEVRKFRFSRMRPRAQGDVFPNRLIQREQSEKLAVAMTKKPGAEAALPAGFTYLGQFIDHDLTQDNTRARLGDQVSVDELIQGRSPMLDLDSLYGLGPSHPIDRHFYQSDGVRLKVGATQKIPPENSQGQPGIVRQDLDGFDLPRVGFGSTKHDRRIAQIPDTRNDENLAVAQVHLAFIRFHNAVVSKLEARVSLNLFERARETVVKHYQWVILHDFLPRIIDTSILTSVFKEGRRFFEVPSASGPDGYGSPQAERDDRGYGMISDPFATMPVEFSVAAYRLGHSMVRESYEWNEVFRTGGLAPGSLDLLFRFSGTSGNLSPPPSIVRDANDGDFERLPTNWIVDFRRLFDFSPHKQVPKGAGFNRAMAINTDMVDPLAKLPPGAFGPAGAVVPALEANLAFRNLERSGMVNLASGQQMIEFFGLQERALTADQIVRGNGGADLSDWSEDEKRQLIAYTPLWFYVLREAEVSASGKLGPVGSRIVAETFHRCMETSRWSIVRDPCWRPDLGRGETFEMTDLLLVAYGNIDGLAPIRGD